LQDPNGPRRAPRTDWHRLHSVITNSHNAARRFDHVTIVVRDVEAAKRFFAFLGFKEVNRAKIFWSGGSSLLAATISPSTFRPEPIDNGRRGNKFTWQQTQSQSV
jgi:hypothetical protein